MKLYQLIQAYSFDELMPVINDMFPGTSKFRPQLENAYNIMLDMKPVPSKKSIKYEMMKATDGSGNQYMGAKDNNFQSTWEVCLGKTLSRAQGVDLSDEELLANIIVNLCLQGKYPAVFEKDHRILMKG